MIDQLIQKSNMNYRLVAEYNRLLKAGQNLPQEIQLQEDWIKNLLASGITEDNPQIKQAYEQLEQMKLEFNLMKKKISQISTKINNREFQEDNIKNLLDNRLTKDDDQKSLKMVLRSNKHKIKNSLDNRLTEDDQESLKIILK